MRFTIEEFDTMVYELLYKETISFDMLCRIADKTLRPTVVNWCKSKEYLRGRGYEDDIMQEIYLRLINTTVDYFLLKKEVNGPYNNNPEGFEDWMFRVAKNLKCDFERKVCNRDFNTDDIDGLSIATAPIESFCDKEERVEKLKQAFSVVLSADVNVYKVLTWLAQSIFVLDLDITKIKSNELIISTFEDKTLYEMYDMILSASKHIPWIVISEAQNEKIMSALQKKTDDNVAYGEVKYSEFFMKHNGEISGKKSISDWMNRMNGMIKRKLDPEYDLKNNKAKKKKRRDTDETSVD